MKEPRKLSLVKLDDPDGDYKNFLGVNGTRFVYLGEIPNMRGHCVVINHRTGRIHSGFHIENFVEVTEDED